MRQVIDNGNWFDKAAAKRWAENTRWNGNNHVSLATGSQYDHQSLYRTARGTWVLHEWSQWQGSRETWELITPESACAWLISQSYFDVANKYFAKQTARAEV